jgi:hypothetical protein
MAIGYELEALVSIYSASAVRLSVSSRPPSWNSDEQSLPPSLPPNSKAEDRPPTSVPMYGGREKGSRDSQAWLDALNDYNAGLSPMERIRYEVNIPAWEAGEKLDGVEDELVPEEPPVMRVLVSLPPTYPNSSPPQLQLLGRYLGSFPIDTGLCEVGRSSFKSGAIASPRLRGTEPSADNSRQHHPHIHQLVRRAIHARRRVCLRRPHARTVAR